MKPFLILQLRPEEDVSDDEYMAMLRAGHLAAEDTHRIRLDAEDIPADLNLADYSGVIVGGGPGCVSDAPQDKSPIEAKIEAAILGLMPQITQGDVPYMGCCYGIGVLAHHLGTEVSKRQYGEPVGASLCEVTPEGTLDPMLGGCPPSFLAFVGHKEAAQALPEGCTHLLSSDACPMQMIRHKSNVYATQFHPEATGDVMEFRIHAYRDRGYFPPDQAQSLIDRCRASDVHAPARILANFVTRYGQ